MDHAFSIKEAIRFGWGKVRGHSGLVFAVVVTMVALQIASSILSQPSAKGSIAAGLGSLFLAFIGVVLGAGSLTIFLRLARAEQARYPDIVPPGLIVWRYFCVSLITGIIIFLPIMGAGLIDLVLLTTTGAVNFSEGTLAAGSGPSIAVAVLVGLAGLAGAVYLSLRYVFAKMAAVDGLGINESMRASANETEGVKWRLALFALALLGINLLGLLCLVVGLLVSVPVSLFAYAYVYLRLKKAKG